MCILQSLCVYYNLYLYTTISIWILRSLCVYYNLYVYTTISMCILQSLCVYYNLYAYTTISMCRSLWFYVLGKRSSTKFSSTIRSSVISCVTKFQFLFFYKLTWGYISLRLHCLSSDLHHLDMQRMLCHSCRYDGGRWGPPPGVWHNSSKPTLHFLSVDKSTRLPLG